MCGCSGPGGHTGWRVCVCVNAGGWPWERTHTFSGEEHPCGEEKTETVSLSKESSAKYGDLFNLLKIFIPEMERELASTVQVCH